MVDLPPSRFDAHSFTTPTGTLVDSVPKGEVVPKGNGTPSFGTTPLAGAAGGGRASTAILPHELALGQNVAIHGCNYLVLGCAGGEVKLRVQGIELKEIAVRLARRRGWAAVADLAEVVPALLGAAGKLLLGWHSFFQFALIGRKIEKHPMDPGFPRGVGVIADQGETLGARRRFRPAQGRRYVLTVSSVLFRNGCPFTKGCAAQLDPHGCASLSWVWSASTRYDNPSSAWSHSTTRRWLS